jgi:hypothetical protein
VNVILFWTLVGVEDYSCTWSYSVTYIRWDSSGWRIGASHSRQSDKTKHSRDKHPCPPGGNRSRSLSLPAASNPLLKPAWPSGSRLCVRFVTWLPRLCHFLFLPTAMPRQTAKSGQGHTCRLSLGHAPESSAWIESCCTAAGMCEHTRHCYSLCLVVRRYSNRPASSAAGTGQYNEEQQLVAKCGEL